MISPSSGGVNLIRPTVAAGSAPHAAACRCNAGACGASARRWSGVAGRCPHTRKLRPPTPHRRTTCPDCRGSRRIQRQPPYPVGHGGVNVCGRNTWRWHAGARHGPGAVHFARSLALCYGGLRELTLGGFDLLRAFSAPRGPPPRALERSPSPASRERVVGFEGPAGLCPRDGCGVAGCPPRDLSRDSAAARAPSSVYRTE